MISGPIGTGVELTPPRGLRVTTKPDALSGGRFHDDRRPPATDPALSVAPLNPPSPANAAVTQHA